jgi:hypothetical protein
LIGNFVLSRQRKDVPIRLFESEAAATTWLRQYLVR